MTPSEPTDSEIQACLDVLARARDLAPNDPRFLALERGAAHLFKSAKKKRRLARRQERSQAVRDRDESTQRVLSYRTGGNAAELPADTEPASRSLKSTLRCYVCKAQFTDGHFFYHRLCPTCSERSYRARSARADLSGRRALVTGGRIKIGFEVARMLLRDGAHVRITTRFPSDALRRFAACEDYSDWRERLAIDALDFRNLPGVIAWLDALVANDQPLDILINNAAQTIRRPAAYYRDLLQDDHALLDAPQNAAEASALMQLTNVFPIGELDEEGRQLDRRTTNSWTDTLANIDPVEAVEVHVVNTIVPLFLNSRLEPLLAQSTFPDRYIVNVSAMEGVFDYAGKTWRHPHTNMAKAALNMMTRTSAADYARKGIYMNSVDTGWVTQENPEPIKARCEANGFVPPLDVVDGAARVYAPILDGVAGNPTYGQFLKDFEPRPF